MDKKLLRFAAAVLAAILLFSFSACKIKDGDSDSSTEEPSVTVDSGAVTESTKPEGENTTGEPTTVGSRPSAQTGPSGTTKPEAINVYSGLNSTNTSKVLRYYKAAAANTKSIDATQLMSIKRVDYTPRNSFQKGMLSLFTGIASAALAANSTPVNEVPGVPDEIKSSDLISANAVAYGNYTIVTLNVRTQQDDQNTKDEHQGPVGRTVGTVGNLDRVFDEMPSIKVDTSKGSITLRYDDCKVVVKIDNVSGTIVSGTWSYTVDIDVDNIYASIAGSDSMLITDTGGAVDYVIKTYDGTTLRNGVKNKIWDCLRLNATVPFFHGNKRELPFDSSLCFLCLFVGLGLGSLGFVDDLLRDYGRCVLVAGELEGEPASAGGHGAQDC